VVCVTHFDRYHFDRVGPANHGGAPAFRPTLADVSESRLERAAAASIGGPTMPLMSRQTDQDF